MKKRKSVLLVPLALTLGMSAILQACSTDGKESASSSTPKPSEGTTASAKPAELSPYEVSIVYWAKPQKDDALIQEKINEYLKPKINATVSLQPIASSDYQKKTELMMNTGEKMDLVFTASWLNFFGNVTKGAFLELDELLEKHGQAIKKQIHPLYLEAPRYKGKLYAIPTEKEITQGKAFTFRKDIVDKYNIPIEKINTMADLEPWLEKMKQSEPNFVGTYVAGGPGGFMMYETNSNYRPIGPAPGKTPLFLIDYKATDAFKVKSVLDPEILDLNKKEVELFRKYYEKGYINADAATATTNIADLRKQGKIWNQTTVWKPGADIELKLTDNYDWVSHVVEEPIVTTDLAAGSMMSIARTSKDPERAMMVMNYLHTDPYLINLLVHGIEDKHYKKAGANRIELIANSGYDPGLFWVVGNQFLNYLKPGQPDDLYENWKKFNNDAKRFPLLGFVFDDTNVKNELSQLTTIATEYKSIGTGAVPEPTKLLEERNAKMKTAGIEKVQAELQKQIDAWWSENKK
jgi:putative aldouronate transport system substrate-binding protein